MGDPDGGGKNAGRELSDFVACYGFPSGFQLTYQNYLRLVLNIGRVRFQHAIAVTRGLAASGVHRLDEEWADAIAVDESEVDELLWDINSARDVARHRMKSSAPE